MPQSNDKTNRSVLNLLMIALAFFLIAGCKQSQPNVLLISIDTLRADHLGLHGNPRDTSPVLDRLAEESLVFDGAFSPAPRTMPSHVMMLTGVHPYRLGVSHVAERFSIPFTTRIVSEHLQAAGYETVAFVDSGKTGWLGTRRGFSRGFDSYHHSPHREGLSYVFDAEATVDAALDWFAQRDTSHPFFMFLHTKSVHDVRADLPRPDGRFFPYDKPEPHRLPFLTDEQADFKWSSPELGNGTLYLESLNKAYFEGRMNPGDFPRDRIEVLKALYDGGIYYTDRHLGRLFDYLRETQLMDDTVIIVTSDHGEGFLEHGFFRHGSTVYSEMLRVPLIIRQPGKKSGRRVQEAVSIGDIPPTILDLVGLPIPPEMEGFPLTGEFPSEQLDRPLFAFIKHRLTPATGASVRQGDWKLILSRTQADQKEQARLYHVSEDPEELHPVQGELERAATMLRDLLAWRDQTEFRVGEPIEIEEETLEHLRAVGYIE